MEPFWHETASGRIKVADAIEGLRKNQRALEWVCLALEEVEDGDYESLINAETLKAIKHIPLARTINLHEVKINQGMQIRIFCSVEREEVTYLLFWDVKKEGHDYKKPAEKSHNNLQAIQYGDDKKISKSIKDFLFNPHR